MKNYSDKTSLPVGGIIAVQTDEVVLTDGKVDYDRLRPAMFNISSMSYHVIGPVVRKAYHGDLTLKR